MKAFNHFKVRNEILDQGKYLMCINKPSIDRFEDFS